MRGFLFCAFLALFGGAVMAAHLKLPIHVHSKINPRLFEDLINSTIEGMRPNIPDPLQIDDYPLHFDDTPDAFIVGDADLSKVEVTGLQGFEVTALSLSIVGLHLDFTVVFPSINVNLDLEGNLLLAHLLPFYDHGPLNIHLEGLTVNGGGNADTTNGIVLSNLEITVTLDSSVFDIHGALDNEDFSAILSEVLNDALTSFVDNHQTVVSRLISPMLQDLINSILAGTDISGLPAAAVH